MHTTIFFSGVAKKFNKVIMKKILIFLFFILSWTLILSNDASKNLLNISSNEFIQNVDSDVFNYVYNLNNKNLELTILFCSLLVQENSTMNHNAVSKANCDGTYDLGLWQLNSRYVDSFVNNYWDSDEEFNVYNWAHNTYIAVRHLQWLANQFDNDYKKTIIAYNAGISNVSRGTISPSSIAYQEQIFLRANISI